MDGLIRGLIHPQLLSVIQQPLTCNIIRTATAIALLINEMLTKVEQWLFNDVTSKRSSEEHPSEMKMEFIIIVLRLNVSLNIAVTILVCQPLL
jgi:hypothetical protein